MATISRKDRHVMTQIIQDLASTPGEKNNIIVFDDNDSLWCSDSHRTEEGYTRTDYVIYLSENTPNWYYVSIHNESRDCDGRYSDTRNGLVKLRTKPQRFYMSRDYKTCPSGRPTGKALYKRVSWRNAGTSMRDYSAEAAGY